MKRSGVHSAMGESPRRGKRNAFAAADYDFFEAAGLLVYYDREDSCVAVELTQDARGVYDGYELFAQSARDVREWARGRDPAIVCDDGFVSRAMGLSMYASWLDEETCDDVEARAPATSFLVFCPGYYDASLSTRARAMR